jgi:hypothetical protein
MATRSPAAVWLRTYQVGFGDCFLLSFHYDATATRPAAKRHVLIDFGTMELPDAKRYRGSPPWLVRVAQHVKAHCGADGLTAVVATHRHQDHVSGFAGTEDGDGPGDVIASCRPRRVIQPWTEHPDVETDGLHAPAATPLHAFATARRHMHAAAERIAELAEARDPHGPFARATATMRRRLAFLGRDNVKNLAAVETLLRMAPPKARVYARHGADAKLGRLLPGVKVHVLGPPDLTQTEAIRKQRTADPVEFWMLHRAFWAATGRTLALPPAARRQATAPVPAELRWLAARIDSLHAEQTLAIVTALDRQMNNTSLILLFEVGRGERRRLLLFPGDAQLETWAYALRDAPGAAATRALLAQIDVYKVGHHGSRNATPRRMLWDTFAKAGLAAGDPRRLRTILSTLNGVHGSAANRSEVPRRTLLDALRTRTDLLSTDDLRVERPKAKDLVAGQDFVDQRLL